LTAAVTVAGVVVVTVVVDIDNETDGVPTVPLVGTTWKPIELVAVVPVEVPVEAANVVVATAVSAPLALAVAGANFTIALPLASVRAVVGLKVPRPPGELNETT
jgi:hypothetical protein